MDRVFREQCAPGIVGDPRSQPRDRLRRLTHTCDRGAVVLLETTRSAPYKPIEDSQDWCQIVNARQQVYKNPLIKKYFKELRNSNDIFKNEA